MKKTMLTYKTLDRFEAEYITENYTGAELESIELAAYVANMNRSSHAEWTESDIFTDFLRVLKIHKITVNKKEDKIMLKDGDKITVHFINHWMHKIPTEEKVGTTGMIFEVKTVNNKIGFDGNINKSPYTCRGELFTPFAAYSWCVIFRNEKTGRLYRYSSMQNDLEEVTNLKDGYIDKIAWLAA